jgi:anti-sigma factor RsiW
MSDPRSPHPETDLVPYLHGELAAAEVERLELHLEGCAACRSSLEEFRGMLAALRASVAEPPPLDWRRYRAELRSELARRSSPRWRRLPALPRLAPALGMVALAALVSLFGWRHHGAAPSAGDLPPFEQAAIGRDLDLLESYPMVENLGLLQDLDVVENLDRLSPREQG